MSKSEIEDYFLTIFRELAPEYPTPERDKTFHPGRRWRFDFSWPSQRVAVEVEGGTWVHGRHTRGAGYARDCEKYNQAQLYGWIVLRFPTDALRIDPAGCVRLVKKALDMRSDDV